MYAARSEVDDECASWSIRCNGKVFTVDVATDNLGDWSGKIEFENLLRDAPDDCDAEESLFDLIYGPCKSLLRTYAPETKDTDSSTLQRYYAPGIIVFKLVGDDNDIKAVRCLDDHLMIAIMLPQIALSDIPDTSKFL